MSSVVWIALAILGVHIVVAVFIMIYIHKSYALLEERSSTMVDSVAEAGTKASKAFDQMSSTSDRLKTGLRVMLDI